MKLQVTVTDIFPIENRPYTKKDGTPGNYCFRNVWVEDHSNPEYPESIELTFSGRTVDYPNAVDAGDVVEVECAISGRKYTKVENALTGEKYTKDNNRGIFMTIRCWSIRKMFLAPAQEPDSYQMPSADNPTIDNSTGEAVPDLPF